MSIKFKINSNKSLESVVYITGLFPGATQYYISKILYYAEKFHLNRYGFPIVGDTYKKMSHGPVPSFVLNLLKQNVIDKSMLNKVSKALNVQKEGNKLHIYPKRPANLYEFSGTELDCIDEAITLCKNKTFSELRDLSHKEPAWENAKDNGIMDYELMIDKRNVNRAVIIADLKERTEFLGA